MEFNPDGVAANSAWVLAACFVSWARDESNRVRHHRHTPRWPLTMSLRQPIPTWELYGPSGGVELTRRSAGTKACEAYILAGNSQFDRAAMSYRWL
jgi:hypothetical protein